MEHMLQDPELAPQVMKILSDSLQNTRSLLDASRKENEDYKAEIARLRNNADANRGDVGDQPLQTIQRELRNIQEENRRLQAEKADLLGIIEGYTSPRGSKHRLPDEGTSRYSTNSHSTRQTTSELEAEIRELRTQLDKRNATCNELRQRAEELEKKLKTHEATTHEQQARLDELRQQINARQVTFDEKENQLRQQLDAAMMKYRQYKTQLQETLAGGQGQSAPRPEGQVYPSSTSRAGQGLMSPASPQHASPVAQSSSGIGRSENTVQGQKWFEVVNYVLSRPCLPITTPSAPFHIPFEVKELMGTATLASCPHRIIYPYCENFARLVAPQAHCKSANQPLDFGPLSTELSQMVGSTREVFYHSATGICYAGTFIGTAVGEVEHAEYVTWEKPMREAIVRHTFPSKGQLQLATKNAQDRLRNAYMTGRAKAQYLELRYIGFNKTFFNAIMDLGRMNADGDRTTAPWAKRPSSATGSDSRTKRARGA